MGDVVIRAQGLGKQYLIGHKSRQERHATFRDVLGRSFSGFARCARAMMLGRQITACDEVEEFWALKDVSFEIKRGEVVGIIGRNGAGKSTLLKVLSRITEPSAGRVEINGRVASLLEVGTGFHPELTGRENIFLNGAILGMSRAEIKRKFDEIVAFAEVEKFLDTPVKRYSSGMYVRLAFAVAAHLEPEILIVDEVLAVGDAEFQKKCMGKMRDVAGKGRTIFLVSHNMSAIQSLCTHAILLMNGRPTFCGEPGEAFRHYLEGGKLACRTDLAAFPTRSGRGLLRFAQIELFDHNNKPADSLITAHDTTIRLTLRGEDRSPTAQGRLGIRVCNKNGETVFICSSDAASREIFKLRSGSIILCHIPQLPLSGGNYWLSLFLERDGVIEDWVETALLLTVSDFSYYGTSRNCPPGWEGRAVLISHSWTIEKH